MRSNLLLALVPFLALLGCAAPSDLFAGDWEVSGSEWFASKGASRPELISGPAAMVPRNLRPMVDVPERELPDEEERTADAVWLLPTRRAARIEASGHLVSVPLGGCVVEAVVQGSEAIVRPGFRCAESSGGIDLERTFSSGTLRAGPEGLEFAATGTFTQMTNGNRVAGAFAVNLELRPRP